MKKRHELIVKLPSLPTLPFVIGILLGAVITLSIGVDWVTVMYLTMAFAGGGVLAKVLLGRL